MSTVTRLPAGRPGAPLSRPVTAPPGPVSASGAEIWRRWRLPLVLVGVILLCGILIALLQLSSIPSTAYLDPASTTTTGAHALTDLLTARGEKVVRVTTPAAAVSAASAAPAAGTPGGVTLVVTSPGLLSARQLAALAQVRANRLLIGPDRAALAALAPAVGLEGTAPVQPLPPLCTLAAAQAAGNADLGGAELAARPAISPPPSAAPARAARTPQVTGCYPAAGVATLMRYAQARQLITVLGAGHALTNGSLGRLGNAALGLNLLRGQSRIIWLVPGPRPLPVSASGQKSLLSVIPLPAYLVAIQLAVAVVLTAAWRSRRLGPLVAEPLPVVVRASETAEGHAGLYRSRRARDRAAAALRAALLDRTLPALGLPPDAEAADVTAAFSARSGSGQDRITAMLFGPPPRDDAALVALADGLDALEREVRTQ